MRGTLSREARGRDVLGIIPAHAGNTLREIGASTIEQGSSPRMRGTFELGHLVVKVKGIIPAHAGNTATFLSGFAWDQDHPRACGEHAFACRHVPLLSGSSPRMRGTHATLRLHRIHARIIPAHAGNTRPSPIARTNKPGSSPRMRGTPL